MSDAASKPHKSLDHVGEASSERIMRYCLGKLLAPRSTGKGSVVLEDGASTDEGVPPFGRIKHCGVDKKRHEKLWEFEIERLKRAAETSDITRLQPTIGDEKELRSWHISDENFAQLRRVADKILYSLWLFSYEDEAVLRDHGYPSSNPDRGSNMFWNFQQIKGEIPDIPLHNRSASHGRDESAVTSQESTESLTANRLEVFEKDQFCYIVDQVTSIVAHIAWNGSASPYWKMIVLACLTKISTKIKVLATQLPMAISRSMHKIGELRPGSPRDDHPHSGFDSDSDTPSPSAQPIVVNYCREYIAMSTWLVECIEHVLRNLGAERPLYEDRKSLDLCTMVYEAGTRGRHTQIYQDRWASISGSTDRLGIHWTLSSLELGSKLLQTLPPPSQLPPTIGHSQNTSIGAMANFRGTSSKTASGAAKSAKTRIRATVDIKNKHLVKDIRNIIDFVVIMTPLSLASPLLGKGFAYNLGGISSRVDIHWGTHQKIELQNAFFSMHRVERQRRGTLSESIPANISARQGHAETTSLARSWLVSHRHRPLWRSSSSSNSLLQQLNSDPFECPNIRAQKDRERLKKITDQWIIQETSIVIKCPRYVNTIFGLTVVLVVGGFLCGLLVGSRVEGVDPFNFTVFSWILGGFILLVAKVVRVSDWTWRDFLQRQVTCRSVCEVANVSELSQQEVLAYLLSSETHQILRTSGPFQKVFSRVAVENGFSIDVSPDIQTLVASGVIPVKVLTVDGEALVFLDLVPGHGSVRNIPVSGSTNWMPVCTDLLQSSEDREDLVLNWQKLSWTKVLGVYNAVEKRIR